jgi:SAM-dependent MidA family methyltransferase
MLGDAHRQTVDRRYMTPLEQKIRRQIAISGPMSIAAFWAQALFDPQFGYYTTKEPFGSSGDFITAPEISQMFGEMLASWWVATVQTNAISNIALVEIGPGRGTLMADMLRTISQIDSKMRGSIAVHMVEASPRLTKIQQQALANSGFKIEWHETPDTLPEQPLGIIANELFDAIAIRQFEKSQDGWIERCIAIDDQNELCFTLGTAKLDEAIVPDRTAPLGSIFEYSPVREAFMQTLAQRIALDGGFGLFIDYGHAKSGFGDTLQGLKAHEFANVLDAIGETDITSHVDFEALSLSTKSAGAKAYPVLEQGEFLSRIGIKERAERLMKSATEQSQNISSSLKRLIDPEQMGILFKVLGISHPDIVLPALDERG